MSVSVGMILMDIGDHGMSFTDSKIKTYRQGLFEDDAFKDLEGTESAEKLLILCRALGYPYIADRRHCD
jgi:homoserine dehydrogenase